MRDVQHNPLQPVKPWWPTEVLLAAQEIRIVFLDVDGVLTDGGLYFDGEGEALKRFHTLDGLGIKLLQRAGIEVAVITGRDSAPLRRRLQALGIERVAYGTEDKLPAAQAMLDSANLHWSQAAAMGDDWPDLPVMRRCALAIAPANAHRQVHAIAHFSTPEIGGHGAVRHLCDGLLMAQGRYASALAEYP